MIPEIRIYFQDNLDFLKAAYRRQSYDLIYIDPPFNTRKTQKLGSRSYGDSIPDYESFMQLRLSAAYDVLKDNGAIIVHCDWREVHHFRQWLDNIFSADNFLNEIIWAYDYGARSKSKWSAKHDNILIYVKDKSEYTFNYGAIERIPYMAPGLVGPEKAARGKTLTDVWWHTIVPTNGKERVGYPTQKPLGIIKRFVEVHSNPGDMCLDFFAGSGTFGEACRLLKRSCDLVDNNPEAVQIMSERLGIGYAYCGN